MPVRNLRSLQRYSPSLMLVDAIEARWTKDEVLAAMIEVADNTALAMHENVLLSVKTELRKLMKKRD